MNKINLLIWVVSSSLVLIGCKNTADENSNKKAAVAPNQFISVLPIGNPGFEASPTQILDWGISQHAGTPAYEHVIDTTQAAEGKHSYRITRTKKQAWGMLSQYLPLTDSAGKTINLSAMLKGENLGADGYDMILVFRKPNHQFISKIKTKPIAGNTDWQKVEVSAIIPDQAGKLQVSGILRGEGTAWVDDIKVTIIDTNLQ